MRRVRFIILKTAVKTADNADSTDNQGLEGEERFTRKMIPVPKLIF